MAKDTRKQLAKAVKSADIKILIEIIDGLTIETREILIQGISSQLTEAKKKKLVTAIKGNIIAADPAIKEWLAAGMGKLYTHGYNDAQVEIKKLGTIKVGDDKLTVQLLKGGGTLQPHLQAVNVLIAEAYADFANGMNGIVRGAEKLINETLRRQLQLQIAEGRLSGAGARKIARTLRATLGERGFTVLIDRGGREWSLKQYTEMLARTHLIRANNEAAVNRYLDFGIDIVEVSAHGATDAICAPLEGMVFSITGKSKRYPQLSDRPPFHPNCVHTLMPRPDLE